MLITSIIPDDPYGHNFHNGGHIIAIVIVVIMMIIFTLVVFNGVWNVQKAHANVNRNEDFYDFFNISFDYGILPVQEGGGNVGFAPTFSARTGPFLERKLGDCYISEIFEWGPFLKEKKTIFILRQSMMMTRHHLEGPSEAADAANGSLQNH